MIIVCYPFHQTIHLFFFRIIILNGFYNFNQKEPYLIYFPNWALILVSTPQRSYNQLENDLKEQRIGILLIEISYKQ
jgi:hypothetical protein